MLFGRNEKEKNAMIEEDIRSEMSMGIFNNNLHFQGINLVSCFTIRNTFISNITR